MGPTDEMEQINHSKTTQDRKPHLISPREVLLKYLPFIPWVAGSVAICLLVAFLKMRYEPNIYSVSGTLLIRDQSSGSSQDKIEEILFSSPATSLSDELQLIRSRNIAKRVVHALGLELLYFNKGNIRESLIKASESPFFLRIIELKDSAASFSIAITIVDDKKFIIGENVTPVYFGQAFETNYGKFSINRQSADMYKFSSNVFIINYTPAEDRAIELVSGLSASISGESASILQLTYETEKPTLGIDIVNQWMKEYAQAGLEEKKQVAENTLDFINEQLETANRELSGVEKNLLNFKEKNRIINPEQQSEQMFSTLSNLDDEITRQGVQLQVVDNLIAYISDVRNPYRQVGTTLGLQEPSLALQMNEFNKLQVERETLLKTTTRSNPMIVSVETAIEKLRQNIIQSLVNVRQGYQVLMNNLSARNSVAGKEISKLPAKEKELLDITRRQKILEELYSFLLQKKLETSISSASTISNVRVVESALASNIPVRPKKGSAYIMAFFIGLALPIGVIFLKEYLNDKVDNIQDIKKATEASIIGEVGHNDQKEILVVSRTSRRFIAEQFRMIRTNLQYILPKQDSGVIIVTSSTSGEGKSFISTNIGAVMALAGKKTVILEFDIRKPKIMSGLNLPKKGAGITNYIIGKVNFEELAVQVPGVDNLFVVPCGPVPPNPAELLLDSRLDSLMQRLKTEYDMIIIDTAPLGLVSDAVVLGKFADASIYVVRHNYTFKKQLQMLDEMYSQKRLPKMSLVMNDVKVGGGYGRYYGYSGFGYSGYGNGYGYGSEYFEEKAPKSSFLSRIFQRKLS